MNLLLGHVLWLTGTLFISLSWEIRIYYEFFLRKKIDNKTLL